jgi:hypothetical protein
VAAVCAECRELTMQFSCITAEAVAIQRDVLARTRAREEISATRLAWLKQVQAARTAILEALRAHRHTHVTAALMGVLTFSQRQSEQIRVCHNP